MDITTLVSYTLREDVPGDYLVTPAVAYFCFDSVDFEFEKSDLLNEGLISDIKNKIKVSRDVSKETKALKKQRTSELTGTVYKLSKEQKRALKYLKKKYGRSLIKEINDYRKNTLAPYQVVKAYNETSKALYPKDVLGMSKEEYLRYKKSAENKILNMRSNRYDELTKEYISYSKKGKNVEDLEDFFGVHDISDTALNKVFKKYGLYSARFTEAEMRAYQKKLNNIEDIKRDLIKKTANSEEITDEDKKTLIKAFDSLKNAKSELSQKDSSSEKNLRTLRNVSKKIEDLESIPDDLKDALQDIIDDSDDYNYRVTTKSFEQEYENFLMREKIREEIRKRGDSKYVDDYEHALEDVKQSIRDRQDEIAEKMARERSMKTFNEKEKKIYELKPGARKDSDRLSDYNLKIKEEDFFEPKFYGKSEKFKDAERKVDAEIKRFERALEAKMEQKDFQLLKKYRLISNLITIKNAKPSEIYKEKEEAENSEEE